MMMHSKERKSGTEFDSPIAGWVCRASCSVIYLFFIVRIQHLSERELSEQEEDKRRTLWN